MLSRHRRIQKKSFPTFSAKGGSFFAESITLRATPQKDKKLTKISVVVSKKVLKTAVGRNRIRRRVYGTIQKHLPSLGEGFFLVFFPKAVIRTISSKELESQVLSLLKSAKVISLRNN
jgi:ribonuclease P protein component